MKIIDIKKEKKNYILVLDTEEIITNENTIIKYYLRKNMELDNDQIRLIKDDSIFFFSYEIAISYLERTICSAFKMKKYLLNKGISEEMSKKVIDLLIKRNLINDRAYTCCLIDHYINLSYGPLYIQNKAYENGIDSQLFLELISKIDDDIFSEKIDLFVSKKIKNNFELNDKNVNKLIMTLLRRGFSYSLVSREVDKFRYENR